MVLSLRHSGEIIGGRASPTCERDDPFTRTKACGAGLGRDRRSLPTIPPARLSVSASGSTSQLPFSYSRPEKRLHSQAASASNHAGSPASAAAAHFDQRLGRASAATGAGAIQIPWLRADASQECVAKSTFSLIVMCSKNSRKFISGWYPSPDPKPCQSLLN